MGPAKILAARDGTLGQQTLGQQNNQRPGSRKSTKTRIEVRSSGAASSSAAPPEAATAQLYAGTSASSSGGTSAKPCGSTGDTPSSTDHAAARRTLTGIGRAVAMRAPVAASSALGETPRLSRPNSRSGPRARQL